MFSDMLYYLGFLPQILQIGILSACALVGYRTFNTSNAYLNQPVIVFLCYYTLTKFIYFIFGIKNYTAIVFIIITLYLMYKLFVRLGLLGLLLSIIMVLWINSLNIYTIILSHPFFNIAVLLIAIHIISQFMDISYFKEILYLVIFIPLLILLNPAVIIEVLFLFEILIRCLFQSHICIDGIAKFFCFIVTCFVGVYLIELAFAHFLLMLIIVLIVRFILKIIS